VSLLIAKGRGPIHLGTPIESTQIEKGEVIIKSGDQTWRGDHLFCALSAKGAYYLTKTWHPDIHTYFGQLETASLSVVHLGYPKKHLKTDGFGYLIPTVEKEKILGVVFDSSVFPEQNYRPNETRLTVMMGGAHHPHHHTTSKEARLTEALEGVRSHLGIKEAPSFSHVSEYVDQIPQFTVGHQERTRHFEEKARALFPSVSFLGNYLKGVSISDCIAKADEASHHLNV